MRFDQHFSHAANQRISQTTTDNSYWSYPPATAATTVYTSNNLDQYTAIGSVSPAYDGNGNLTFDSVFTYGYDAENRLISASGAGNTASYAYDASSQACGVSSQSWISSARGRADGSSFRSVRVCVRADYASSTLSAAMNTCMSPTETGNAPSRIASVGFACAARSI